jgi:hypothetical protein
MIFNSRLVVIKQKEDNMSDADVVEVGTMEFSNNAAEQVLKFRQRAQQKFAEKRIRQKIQAQKKKKGYKREKA